MGNSFLYTVLQQKILPAVTFSTSDEVIPVAEAILKGGLHVVEIPFRTAVAASSVADSEKIS
jgi:2-keto-3-deoxy-6-phosphogluconate aldolase